MKRVVLSLAVFLFAVAASTRITNEAPSPASMRGFVYDGATYQAIDGVKIEIAGKNAAVSNANGAFDLANIEQGVQTITASKPGYVTYTATINVNTEDVNQKLICLLKK